MTSFISQSGALRERIGKSGAWISNVGRNAAYSDPSFTRRCHSVSLDGYYNEDGFFTCHNRHLYEQNGCVFAPLDIAKHFSHEIQIPETVGITPFGFHGKNNPYNNLI